MSVTVLQDATTAKGSGRMGRAKKPETKPVRLYKQTADLAAQLAGIFGQDIADFLDPIIRPALEKKRQEAADILLGKKKKTKDE